MTPVLLLTIGLTPNYDGISYQTLCSILELGSCVCPGVVEDMELQLESRGAYSERSYPLYLKVLTTDENDPSVPDKERWNRLRFSVPAGIIPKVKGDKSIFIPHGIRLLTDPNPGMRMDARLMLVEIATAKDIPAVVKVIDRDDPKKAGTAMEAAMVLSAIGGADEVKFLDELSQCKAVQSDKEALRIVTGSRDALKARLEAKAKPSEKKDK